MQTLIHHFHHPCFIMFSTVCTISVHFPILFGQVMYSHHTFMYFRFSYPSMPLDSSYTFKQNHPSPPSLLMFHIHAAANFHNHMRMWVSVHLLMHYSCSPSTVLSYTRSYKNRWHKFRTAFLISKYSNENSS